MTSGYSFDHNLNRIRKMTLTLPLFQTFQPFELDLFRRDDLLDFLFVSLQSTPVKDFANPSSRWISLIVKPQSRSARIWFNRVS